MLTVVRLVQSTGSRFLLGSLNRVSAASVRGFQSSKSLLLGMDGQSETQVHHDADKKTFSLRLKGGARPAVLAYDWVGDGVIDFYHTEVPVEFRGHGIAKILAKTGLDFAVQKNLKIALSCTYMAKYVAENPLPEYTQQLYSLSRP